MTSPVRFATRCLTPSLLRRKATLVGLPVARRGDRDVRKVDRHFLGDDAALFPRRLALVAAGDIDAADHGAVLGRDHADDLAAPALVLAGDDDHAVALPDARGHHRTSGASEMIFMWFLARSSRGTGPKMRVPTGSD